MKVLILSASTGGGHNRAAGALKEYILQHDPDSRVEIVDSFKDFSVVMNTTVTKGYQFLVTKTPSLFGKMYEASDRESILSDMVESFNKVLAKNLVPLIEEMHPDIIVSCHPFAGKMIATLKKTRGYDIPFVSILTDFMPHMSYINDEVDAYITATPLTARVLAEHYGIDKDRIHPLGMPIYERFYTCSDEHRADLIRELGFDVDKPTVLVMAGSFGVTDILKIYEQMVSVDLDYQIIIVTGRNKRLYSAFEKMLGTDDEFETEEAPEFIRGLTDDNPIKILYNQYEEQIRENLRQVFRRSTDKKKPTRLFCFVDNVEDYMHISNLIITKPGGLTTSESLACCLPMAIFKAFPGQEAQNADFLTENGIAVMLSHDNLSEQITAVLGDPERLQTMRDACKLHAPRHSCERIYDLLQQIVN